LSPFAPRKDVVPREQEMNLNQFGVRSRSDRRPFRTTTNQMHPAQAAPHPSGYAAESRAVEGEGASFARPPRYVASFTSIGARAKLSAVIRARGFIAPSAAMYLSGILSSRML
jgi:hypothetical protein